VASSDLQGLADHDDVVGLGGLAGGFGDEGGDLAAVVGAVGEDLGEDVADHVLVALAFAVGVLDVGVGGAEVVEVLLVAQGVGFDQVAEVFVGDGAGPELVVGVAAGEAVEPDGLGLEEMAGDLPGAGVEIGGGLHGVEHAVVSEAEIFGETWVHGGDDNGEAGRMLLRRSKSRSKSRIRKRSRIKSRIKSRRSHGVRIEL
jgi:hypothetical protein